MTGSEQIVQGMELSAIFMPEAPTRGRKKIGPPDWKIPQDRRKSPQRRPIPSLRYQIQQLRRI